MANIYKILFKLNLNNYLNYFLLLDLFNIENFEIKDENNKKKNEIKYEIVKSVV